MAARHFGIFQMFPHIKKTNMPSSPAKQHSSVSPPPPVPTGCVSGLSGAPTAQPQGRAVPAGGGSSGLLAGEAGWWSGGGSHRQGLRRQGDLPQLVGKGGIGRRTAARGPL